MKITIITVCFNAEAHIGDCLASVAGQTHGSIEHIVIDGASVDRTVEIVRRFPHVKHLVSERDAGIYDAMNKGLGLATGDFILFLNADDRLPAAATLATAAEMIGRHPGADVYYGWLEVRPLEGAPSIYRPLPPEEAATLMICGCLPHQSTLARPSVFRKTGPFDLKYRYHADYDWFLKVLADPAIKVRALPCVIGSFKEGGASSQLAKGQPEVYAIQNASPVYAGAAWDERRIAEYQKTLLNERLENARLRERLRSSRRRTGAPLVSGSLSRLRASMADRWRGTAIALRARKWR